MEEAAQHSAAWTYVAGSLGVIFCGDYLTLFLFWELMAFSSVFLVWFRRRKESLASGYRYLLVHTAGGLLLLAGLVLRYRATGDLTFGPIGVADPQLYTYLIMSLAISCRVRPRRFRASLILRPRSSSFARTLGGRAAVEADDLLINDTLLAFFVNI